MAATMKHRAAEDLRRRHSLREVASITGLPLGAVKAIASQGLCGFGHAPALQQPST